MRALAVVAFLACLAGCSSGASDPAGPNTPPSAPPPSPAEGPLSGRWVGLTSEGRGLISTDRTRDDYCINLYDWSGTLSQQGTKLAGNMTLVFVGADCRSAGHAYHVSPADMGAQPVQTSLTISVNPSGGASIPWGEWVSTVGGAAGDLNQDLAGNYTTDTIALSGDRAAGRSSWSVTFGLRRQ